MGKKPEKKSNKDSAYKLDRTAANKARRAARMKRRVRSAEHKTAKNKARKARMLAAAKKLGCADYKSLQKKRAYLNSFDSSVEVIKVQPKKANPLDEALSIAFAIGKVG